MIVATTAATLPPVRRAVHHYTAPSTPPAKPVNHAPPCTPLDHKTFASELPGSTVIDTPPEPVPVPPGPNPNPYPNPTPNPNPFPYPGPNPTPNPNPTPPPVPEPAAWMTMVLGFGLIGGGVRQRRHQLRRARALATAGGGASGSIKGPGALMGGGVAAIASMLGAGVSPVQAGTKIGQAGAKSLHASLLAKAAMCVCPPVAMAVTAATVPPVRHAVYNATAPKAPLIPAAPGTVAQSQPCVPVDVPTAAEAVKQGGDQLAVFKPTPAWPS